MANGIYLIRYLLRLTWLVSPACGRCPRYCPWSPPSGQDGRCPGAAAPSCAADVESPVSSERPGTDNN